MATNEVPIKLLDKKHKQDVYKALEPWETGFTIGVLSYTINCVMLMRWPSYFWIMHMVKTCIHLPWRYMRFKPRGWQWYLADFCYANNYLIFICLIITVLSHIDGNQIVDAFGKIFIRAGFAFGNGALALAIALFHNKLVFHDVDNTTSVFIHYSPAALYWTLRWGGGYGTADLDARWPGLFNVCPNMTAPNGLGDWTNEQTLPPVLWDSTSCPGNFTDFVVYPAICWLLCWGLPYYVYFFLYKGWGDQSKAGENQFLYRDTINDTAGMGKFVRKLPESLWPLGYMLQHFLFSLVTSLFSLVFWHSFVLHTVFLFGLLFVAIHNGSAYMFRVVAARKVAEVVLSNTPLLAESDTAKP